MELNLQIDLRRTRTTDPFVVAVLAETPQDRLLPVVDALIAATDAFDRHLLDAALAAVESRGLLVRAELDGRLAETSVWRQSLVGLWLTASLLESIGDGESALGVWNQILSNPAAPASEAHLSRSKLHYRLGNLQKSFADLRQAVAGREDFAFLVKAARLLSGLRKRARPPVARRIRIALLSSTTTDLLAPLLQLACFRDGIDTDLYVAPYGTFQQEILDPQSGLYRFGPDYALIATNWRDANVPPYSDRPDEHVGTVIDEFQRLWRILLERSACRVIQHNFDLPAIDSYGHLSRTLPGGRARMLREINRRLLEVAPPAVALLDLDHVSGEWGKRAWYDASYWNLAKQYPAPPAVPFLVDHQVALIRADLGLTKKVLVLDLDNTLWGGVIGEDGLEGIRLGSPSAAGEAYQALQKYVLELKERGVILAVCSKNNDDEAKLPFVSHDSTILHLDDFAAFCANWRPKSDNLREIARKINVGLDSIVFLDDNPVERSAVRRELPEVAVPELTADPSDMVPILDSNLYFESLVLTEEDRERNRTYLANVVRDEMKATAGSLDDFLTALQMEAEIGAFDEIVLPRVAQLIGKTNQFNLTTRRYSLEELRVVSSSDEFWSQYFKLSDCFGDNGLIGIMIARKSDAPELTWEVETWLMSCRVIGRRMEDFMLQTLLASARSVGAKRIRGIYIPTAKNGMVADLYPRLGFTAGPTTDCGEMHYDLDLEAHDPTACGFIRSKRRRSVAALATS